MPTNFQYLKTKAAMFAANRDHDPIVWGRATKLPNSRIGYTCTGKCPRCERTVTINSHPLANEIDIAGEAVAMGCRPTPSNQLGELERQIVILAVDNHWSIEDVLLSLKARMKNAGL